MDGRGLKQIKCAILPNALHRAPVRHGRARIETGNTTLNPKHLKSAPVRHGRARIETSYHIVHLVRL